MNMHAIIAIRTGTTPYYRGALRSVSRINILDSEAYRG